MVDYKSGEFPLLDDIAFKEVFGRMERIEYSEYLLETYLNKPVGSLKGEVKVLLDKTLKKNHLNEHGMILDVVMMYQNVIYNFEAYRKFDKVAIYKTIAYGDKIFSSELNRGESYKTMKRVEQVVIAEKVEINLEKKFRIENCFRSKRKVLSDIQSITILRVDKAFSVDYNDNAKDKRLRDLIHFISVKNQKMREKIAKKEKGVIRKMNEFIKEFSEEFEVPVGYDRNEFHYAQGLFEEKENTARNLLKENCDDDFISKITGLSKKEIHQIKKEEEKFNMQVA